MNSPMCAAEWVFSLWAHLVKILVPNFDVKEEEESHTTRQFSDTYWVSYNLTNSDTTYQEIASGPTDVIRA